MFFLLILSISVVLAVGTPVIKRKHLILIMAIIMLVGGGQLLNLTLEEKEYKKLLDSSRYINTSDIRLHEGEVLMISGKLIGAEHFVDDVFGLDIEALMYIRYEQSLGTEKYLCRSDGETRETCQERWKWYTQNRDTQLASLPSINGFNLSKELFNEVLDFLPGNHIEPGTVSEENKKEYSDWFSAIGGIRIVYRKKEGSWSSGDKSVRFFYTKEQFVTMLVTYDGELLQPLPANEDNHHTNDYDRYYDTGIVTKGEFELTSNSNMIFVIPYLVIMTMVCMILPSHVYIERYPPSFFTGKHKTKYTAIFCFGVGGALSLLAWLTA